MRKYNIEKTMNMEKAKIILTLYDNDTWKYHILTDGKTVCRVYPNCTFMACTSADFQALKAFGLWHDEEIEK